MFHCLTTNDLINKSYLVHSFCVFIVNVSKKGEGLDTQNIITKILQNVVESTHCC